MPFTFSQSFPDEGFRGALPSRTFATVLLGFGLDFDFVLVATAFRKEN
jgi:hypothetical protein